MTGPVDLPFQVGQSVIYPGRGEARVEKVEDIEVGGVTLPMYVFSLRDGGVIKIPLQKVKASGVRPIGGISELQGVVACLKSRAHHSKDLWMRRAVHFNSNLVSGDLSKVAEVVRDLQEESKGDAVSFSVREVYDRALYLLLGEVSHIKKCSVTEAVAYLSKESGMELRYREGMMKPQARPALSQGKKVARKPPSLPAENKAEPPKKAPPKAPGPPGKSNLIRLKPGSKPKVLEEKARAGPDPEIARLQHVVAMLEQQRDTLTAQNERLQTENEALRTEVESLRAKNRSLTEDLATVRSSEASLRERIANLESILAEKEASLANIPASPENVPAVRKRRGPAKAEPPPELRSDGEGFLWNPEWDKSPAK